MEKASIAVFLLVEIAGGGWDGHPHRTQCTWRA